MKQSNTHRDWTKKAVLGVTVCVGTCLSERRGNFSRRSISSQRQWRSFNTVWAPPWANREEKHWYSLCCLSLCAEMCVSTCTCTYYLILLSIIEMFWLKFSQKSARKLKVLSISEVNIVLFTSQKWNVRLFKGTVHPKITYLLIVPLTCSALSTLIVLVWVV